MNQPENSYWNESRRDAAGRIIILICTAIALTLEIVTLSPDTFNPEMFRAGEVAKFTVKAPRDQLLEDTLSTEKLRGEARALVPKVFTIRPVTVEQLTKQLGALFSTLTQLAGHGAESVLTLGTEERINFERQYTVDFAGEEWEPLLDKSNWTQLEAHTVKLVAPIMQRGVIASKKPLEEALDTKEKVMLRAATDNGFTEEIITTKDIFIDLGQAFELLKESIPEAGLGRGSSYDAVVLKLAQFLLKPNVVYDNAEVATRIAAAESAVSKVYVKVRKSEVIARAGNLISPDQAWKIERLFGENNRGARWKAAMGYSLLTILILLCSYAIVRALWQQFQPRKRDLIVISLTLVGSLLLLRATGYVASALEFVSPEMATAALVLATPIAAGGIMLQVTLGMASVLVFLMSLTLITGVFLENSWLLCVIIFVGNSVGALSMQHSGRRTDFLRAGVRIAAVNVLVVMCFYLLYPGQEVGEISNRVLWSAVGGLISGLIGIALTPFAEWIGGYVTDFRLLELASLDQTLLKDLSLQAPGTWNHSMVIGQIGEAAAEAIGANALLTRVGAYYHDIGKVKKPAYFVENQSAKENRHDKLAPSMSALIIKAHVKDGVELARKHRLPQILIDFIPQHHGTALIEYFYARAKEECSEADEVDESHYRYGGPKPQSKEAGILMLADAVEASSRTLIDPTPAKIQGLVQKIMNKIFVSGELEESNLTLKDLHLIARSFTRVLSGIYHRRVEYSEPAEKVREQRNEEIEGTKILRRVELPSDITSEEHKDASRSASTSGEGKPSAENTPSGKTKKPRGDTIKRLGI